MTAPTEVEAALGDVDDAIEHFAEGADVVDGDYGQSEPNYAMRQHTALTTARANLARHIAAQDAEIARLREALERKMLIACIAHPDFRQQVAALMRNWLHGEIDEDPGDHYARGFNDYRERTLRRIEAWEQGETK